MNLACRIGLLSLLGLSLVACNSMTQTSVESIVRGIQGPPPLLTIDDVNNAGQPLLLVRYDQSQSSMASANPAQSVSEWQGRQQMLVLHNGRLVQSAGLPDNADIQLSLAADDPFVTGLLQVTDGYTHERQVDYPKRYLTGLRQLVTYRQRGQASLELMGQTRAVQRIDERVHLPELGFTTTNRYWLDPDSGHILQSEQTLLPGLAPLVITLLQPTRTGVTP